MKPRTLALVAPLLLLSGCAADPGPSRDLTLHHIVLYQNGVGYFERSGMLREERLHLRLKQREVDDVMKTLVVVEEGAGHSRDKPSTATALLPKPPAKKASSEDGEESTWLDVVFSPRPQRAVTIAYAVPTAAWKAAYRVVLGDAKSDPKQALLQAWAVIDNVSDEDWSGVKLSLATGAPLTFATDLRSARFVARPDANGNLVEPTATGPVVAERSRTGDSDGDGIPDQQDACPREPGAPNSDAARDGCPTFVKLEGSTVRVLQQVHFPKNSSAVAPESTPMLDEMVQLLKGNPGIRIAVEGHSSSDEPDAWGLSGARAGAVKAYLTGHGVKGDIKVTGFGSSRPLDDNGKDTGRQANRRVEFHIIEESPGGGGTSTGGSVSASSAEHSVRATAVAHDAAGMIRYDISNAVSIPRQSSTMVTLINEYVPGEEVFLFRPDPNLPGSEHYPMRAARLENKSGFGLQPGPVAIFGGGTFVGEGLLGKLNPGETTLIPYGIDSSTLVEAEHKDALNPLRLVSLSRGVMIVENSSVVTTRYKITTGMSVPGRIFLRHPRSAGYESGSLPPATEKTDDAYLIPIPIVPQKTSVLDVEERATKRDEITILTADGATLGLYLKGSALAPDLDKAVREVVELRTELGKIEERTEALRSQLVDAGQRNGELRESLRAIEKTPRAAALQRQLLDRLSEAARQSEDLSAKLAKESVAATEARTRLAERLRDLHVDEVKH